jgi:hypothetical protein
LSYYGGHSWLTGGEQVLISAVIFYYIINKLIILIHNSYYFNTDLSLKVPLNRYFFIFNYLTYTLKTILAGESK